MYMYLLVQLSYANARILFFCKEYDDCIAVEEIIDGQLTSKIV